MPLKKKPNAHIKFFAYKLTLCHILSVIERLGKNTQQVWLFGFTSTLGLFYGEVS